MTTVLKDKYTTVFWYKFLSKTPCGTRDPPYLGGDLVTLGKPREPKSPCYSSEIMWKCFQDYLLSPLYTHTPLDCGPTTHNGGILKGISPYRVRLVSFSITIELAQSHNKEKCGLD